MSFSFLDLARELRDQVYDEALKETKPFKIRHNGHILLVIPGDPGAKTTLGWALANKQMLDEALNRLQPLVHCQWLGDDSVRSTANRGLIHPMDGTSLDLGLFTCVFETSASDPSVTLGIDFTTTNGVRSYAHQKRFTQLYAFAPATPAVKKLVFKIQCRDELSVTYAIPTPPIRIDFGNFAQNTPLPLLKKLEVHVHMDEWHSDGRASDLLSAVEAEVMRLGMASMGHGTVASDFTSEVDGLRQTNNYSWVCVFTKT